MKREPNAPLAALMGDAGLSNKALAGRVRRAAQEAGLDISPDHVSVRRWLDGVKPRTDTAQCVATALSVKLGRRVTPGEIGFDASQTDPDTDVVEDGAHYPDTPARSIEIVEKLADADMGDRPAVTSSTWVQTATPSIVYGYLGDGLTPSGLTLPGESSAPLAERIHATVNNLMGLDFQFGGGHVRGMLLMFWKTEIVPQLRANHSEPVRREVFRAAADAAEVLAWSAYDAGRHGLAQRYDVQGLRLAKEAGDRLKGGQILADLSHQANYLGHYADAVKLARSAQLVTGGNGPATVEAMFVSMEARGLASQGQATECAQALHRAEQIFERSDPANDPDWISYFDSLELAGEAAHCFRDLGKPEETKRFTSEALDPKLTPPRTRAFINMVSADGALAGGDLDEAVTLATDAIRLAGSLQSDRYLRYVGDFHRKLTGSYAGHPMAREFEDLLRETNPVLIQ